MVKKDTTSLILKISLSILLDVIFSKNHFPFIASSVQKDIVNPLTSSHSVINSDHCPISLNYTKKPNCGLLNSVAPLVSQPSTPLPTLPIKRTRKISSTLADYNFVLPPSQPTPSLTN
ncbi:hypothetical protein CR513_01547, partial [Mucuna pruriens]